MQRRGLLRPISTRPAACAAAVRVSALKIVDLPTLGSPTIPHLKPMKSFQLPSGLGDSRDHVRNVAGIEIGRIDAIQLDNSETALDRLSDVKHERRGRAISLSGRSGKGDRLGWGAFPQTRPSGFTVEASRDNFVGDQY